MAARDIRLLHVEDNLAHRRLIGHYLAGIKEYAFDIYQADSEDAAVDTFKNGGIELVLLDYHLTQGDGLSCLRKLRSLDPLVPIVALSGAATPEIASELLEVGADDYLSKQDLSREVLANSVRNALHRVELVKTMPAAAPPQEEATLEGQLFRMCADYAAKLDPVVLKELDEFEAAARQARINIWQLQHMFSETCTRLSYMKSGPVIPAPERLLRPLLLEIVLRVFGNLPLQER